MQIISLKIKLEQYQNVARMFFKVI